MNKAKLVNSVLTGGGIIGPQHLNVIIGNEDKGFPRGHVLDANATLALAGNGGGSGTQEPSELEKIIGISKFTKNYGGVEASFKNLDINLGLSKNINIDINNNGGRFSEFKNEIAGFGNINSGLLNFSSGYNNITIGSGIASNGYNSLLSSSFFTIDVVKHNENNKLRLKIRTNSFAGEIIKQNGLLITDKYAFIKQGDQYVLKLISESGFVFRNTSDNTRIDDNTVQFNNSYLSKLKDYDRIFAYSIYNESKNSILFGQSLYNGGNNNSIFVGKGLIGLQKTDGKYSSNIAMFGKYNNATNEGEFVCGVYNKSTRTTDGDIQTMFSIGNGRSIDDSGNALEVALFKQPDQTYKDKLYINGIGGYDGTNVTSTQSKSLQQVISDIEMAVSLNSNGPWDVDITSQFVNGNVTIFPTQMWKVSQDVKRVYFVTDLKQGDVITIPDTLRMYIGWKRADGTFGLSDWTASAKKYTATEDAKYVILLDTPAVNNPGVQTNTISTFGNVMLRTSNPEFKPTAKTDVKKDHTNDDKIMRGIAHQGFHKTENPNSLAAFRAAAKEGWRYVETDTYMTSDGKFIVSHDDNVPIGYTNGVTTLTDKSYKYGDHTLADILAFHGPNGEKIDTLEEFCKVCKECGLHPYIEIKQGMMWQTNTIDTTNPRYSGKPYAIKLLDIVNRYGLRGNATFISSTAYTLRLMAEKDQSYRYGIVYFGKIESAASEWTALLNQINEFNTDATASKAYLFADVNIVNLKTAEAVLIDKLAETGCQLEVWTAKIKDDLDNLDSYVTGVTSDNIHAGEILAKNI